MLSVQLFEAMLSALALLAGVRNPGRKIAAHRRERFLRQSFKRHWHAFRKSSARESYRALEGHIDRDLLTQIDHAIKWRDRLAHRYLREKFHATEEGGLFVKGTIEELVQLDRSFERLGRRLNDEMQRITADWPRSDIPPEARRALEEISLAISFDRPMPRKADDP